MSGHPLRLSQLRGGALCPGGSVARTGTRRRGLQTRGGGELAVGGRAGVVARVVLSSGRMALPLSGLWSQALGELCESFSFPLPLPSLAWGPGDRGHLYLHGAVVLAWGVWAPCPEKHDHSAWIACPQSCAEWEAPDIPPHTGQAVLSSWAE